MKIALSALISSTVICLNAGFAATAPSTIKAGEIRTIDGSQSHSPFRILGGGILEGTGKVGSVELLPFGVLAPGSDDNALGKLQIEGTLTAPFSSRARIHAARVRGELLSDEVQVEGSASFFGTIELFLGGEPLREGDIIPIIRGPIALPGTLDVPARVLIDPESVTPLPSGLEAVVAYGADRISVQIRRPEPANLLRNGSFEEGLFFWETVGPHRGAEATVGNGFIDPASGSSHLSVELERPGNSWSDLQVVQHFPVRAGQRYTVAFEARADEQTDFAWQVGNSLIRRDLEPPAVAGIPLVEENLTRRWQTFTRSFTAGQDEGASLSLFFGECDRSARVDVDNVRITTDGAYPQKPDPFRIVGYLPAYRFGPGDLVNTHPERIGKVDTLIYGFIMTDRQGMVLEYYQQTNQTHRWPLTPKIKQTLRQLKSDHGLELLVALGGGGADETVFFENVNSDPSKRQRLIQNLIRFCNENGFDGVDLDYEYAEADSDQQENYGSFVAEAKAAFSGAKKNGENLILTAAVDTFSRAYYPPDAYTAHRGNHLMNYPFGLEENVLNILQLYNAGAPMASIYPGIIWAAKNADGETTAYRNLVSENSLAPHENSVAGWNFNGIDAVRQKIELARALGCGGIMIWELGHDTGDAAQSLIINALLDEWEEPMVSE